MARKSRTAACIRGLYLRGDQYIYQPPMVEGVRPNAIYLGTGDFAEAVLEVEDRKRRDALRAVEEEMQILVDRFLVAKARSKKHKGKVTTDSARIALKRFRERFRSLGSIRLRDLEAWRDDMIAERKKVRDKKGNHVETGDPALSLATIAGYLRYAQSLCSWAAKEGIIRRSPFEGAGDLFPKKLPTKRANFCTKEERDRLIQGCDHLDLQAVLFFGFHAGLRRNEILNLRPSWLLRAPDGSPTHIHVREDDGKDGTTQFTIKDGEPKVIPMTRPLVEFVVRHRLHEREPYLVAPEIRGGGYRYRWDFKRRWETYMRNQGVVHVTPHTMRHTFVTLLLSAPPEKRPSLLHLERWTGDSVETLKKHYAHLLDDAELINAAN